MNKIWLVTQREYLNRIRKKSFLILTLLGPLIYALLFAAPIAINKFSQEQQEFRVAVRDETGLLQRYLESSEQWFFSYGAAQDKSQGQLPEDYQYLLDVDASDNLEEVRARLILEKELGIAPREQLRSLLKEAFRQAKIERFSIDQKTLNKLETSVDLETLNLNREGPSSKASTFIASAVAIVFSFLNYFFILIYGGLIMRSVLEEKTNRISEIIALSVKPHQLMAGKIVGVGLAGLTQFAFWVLVIAGLTLAAPLFLDLPSQAPQTMPGQTPGAAEVMTQDQSSLKEGFAAFMGMEWGKILLAFLFFFLTGYMFYGGVFAATGAASEAESDTQQFVFPILVPLLIAIIVMQTALTNPNSSIIRVFSHIPFFSPVIMAGRVAFGVGWGELLLSMGIMAVSTYLMILAAGKVFRVGLLSYGQKPSFSLLWKWLRH